MTTIHVYADPLDPRGWGSEPALRRLRLTLPDADWQLRPVEMVPDWDSYTGPELPGREAAAATCARVSEESGMPIDEFLWFQNPPERSGPATRGVAAALEQGETAGWRFLRAAREATYIRRTNLDTDAAVVDLAASVPDLDTEAFETALDAGPELPDCSAATEVHGVGDAGGRPELPTITVRGDADERGLSGFADAASLDHVVQTATGSTPEPARVGAVEAVERFSAEGWLAPIELAALAGVSYDDAVDTVADAEGIVERGFASERFFRSAEYVADAGEAEDADTDE
ncbi:hypothetical protein JCM30237_30610 [Halolamina litorea]|uniref:DsbA family protein n=1 Tax=Halolamina litorea TaxID=1515593 RepID=A0ABD6BMV1_9EURY|nr:DsbA family protein [Halolamina litorea]